MSDEKDTTKDQNKEEQKLSTSAEATVDKEEKTADLEVEKESTSAEATVDKEEKTAEVKKNELQEIKEAEEEEEGEIKKGESQLEELPDEIKKKLEKRKAEKDKKGKSRKKKKKEAKRITVGNAYVKASYNNTIITLTDKDGNVISWASAGMAGFKGPKKSTPYAASIITRIAVEKAREDCGLEEVDVFVKGVGTGRESAVRALNANGLNVVAIKDITPIPHNGCRKRRPRRV